jgi:hypothetical protein
MSAALTRNHVFAMAVRVLAAVGSCVVLERTAHAQSRESIESPVQSNPSGKTPLQLLRDEAKLYLDDSFALVRAPFGWDSSDWRKAGAVGVGIGGLMLFDESLAHEVQERRSAATDRLSRLTTRFGAADAFYVSGALVVSGILFKDSNVTWTGREAIEATVFTGIIVSLSKRAFGRERPMTSGGETVFRPGSSSDSFPSGHAAKAFTLASVVAARSRGWVIPTLAYTGASLVAYSRVNDRAHFPSDVVASAALGIAVGRFVVRRHQSKREGSPVEIEMVPARGGAELRLRF